MTASQLKSNPLIALVDEVSRLQGRFGSLFDTVHAASGLKLMQDIVLNAVYEADRPPTVPQIGRSLGPPRQVIQRAVNELVDEGLLQRLPNPDHKRAPLFAVTAKGLQLKQRTDAIALAICDDFFRSNEPQQCEQLAGELRQLRKALEAFARQRQAGGGD
ncbi:MarR family winged helix-turn-helix transcriptional regulator [Haliea sp. E17]|uniref:MarR family winged helix-turn-helix transcriptional regulator n=1 Tax=Haliea sp. E17 TaxID=3401576 RepID=UPI003AAEF550